jgi:TonB-dependent receptor
LFSLLGFSPLINAASVSGTVYDVRNGIFLESATIQIRETGQQTTSQRGGRYRFGNVEPGEYVFTATATGYPTKFEQIRIDDPNAEVILNFRFYDDDEIYELDAFVVEGAMIGQAKSLSLRRSAAELQEIVASDAFGQFADRNPGEALQRVAGITVEDDQGEGSFVIIRGASPDLSNIQIDGVGLATPQEDGRRVNLNVITVDQLERIEVSKTWLPFQSGNVIGGTVNMVTRSALDRGEMFASLEGAYTHRGIVPDEDSYRMALTFGHVLDGDTFEWLGDKAIGFQFSVNKSEDTSGSHTARYVWTPNAQLPHNPDTDGGAEIYGYTMREVQANDFQVIRNRLGLSSRLEFRLNESHEFHAAISYNRFEDDVRNDTFNSSIRTTAETGWRGPIRLTHGIVDQLGLDPNDPYVSSRLRGSGKQGHITFAESIQLGDLDYYEPWKQFTHSGIWTASYDRGFTSTLKNDRIITLQGGGKHRFGENISADWKVYNSEAERDEEIMGITMSGASGTGYSLSGPEHRYPHIRLRDADGRQFNPEFFDISPPSGAGPRYNQTWSSDERTGFTLDLTGKFDLGPFEGQTRLGAALDNRDKSYRVQPRSFSTPLGLLDSTAFPGGRLLLSNPIFNVSNNNRFAKNFGEDLAFGPRYDKESTLAFLRDPEAFGAKYNETFYRHNLNIDKLNQDFSSRVTSNYDASEDISAYYFQQQLKWKDWTFIFGARYEKTENEFESLEIITRNPELPQFIQPTFWRHLPDEDLFSRKVTASRSYDHLLPALHVRKQLFEDVIVRLSATKTIARPLFTDLIPREIPQISGGSFDPVVQLPAFDLNPMESKNFDFSIDYFTKSVGLISLAIFHKDLNGAIYDETWLAEAGEETLRFAEKYDSLGRNNTDYTLQQKRNAGKGKLSGIEITVDRRLDLLPGFLNGFGVNSNIAWFDSEVTLLSTSVASGQSAANDRGGEVVPLFRQPKMTANASIYYNKHGLFARISYNRRGSYLDAVAGGGNISQIRDFVGDPANAFDVYVADGHRWDFTLRYNITPSIQVFFEAINFTNEPYERYRGNETRPFSIQYTQAVYTFGLKWNL